MVRYFNPEWFKRNKDSIQRQLNFWGEVMWWLNLHNARIKIYKTEARFWTIDKKGKFDLIKIIRFTKTGKWDIPPSKALKSPVTWALALRMKYIELPRTWKRLSEYLKFKGGKACLQHKDGNYRIYFADAFGNRIGIPLDFFEGQNLDLIDKWRRTKISNN